MIYRITHDTGYSYSAPASLSQNELYLTPRTTASQELLENELTITPDPQYETSRTDFFGNAVQLFMIQHTHEALAISAQSLVRTTNPVTPEPSETLPWEAAALRLNTELDAEMLDANRFCYASPLVRLVPGAREYALHSFQPDTPLLAGAIDLIKRIFTDFTYDKSVSTVDTTVDQILKNRSGVCQDFAHLALSCLRSLNLAARYVSGYLETLPPPGKPKLVGADASHAWISVFIPDFGWVDLDPTNNLFVNETYITLAWGRDYGDVAPVKGVVMGGGYHDLHVTVDVSRDKT